MTGWVSTDLLDRVRTRLVDADRDPTPALIADALRTEAGGVLSDADLLRALHLLDTEFRGAGVLDAVLREPGVTDVLVTGPDDVWVDRGHGLRRAEVGFGDEAAVRRLAQRLALSAGRRLDDAQPWVDGRLPGTDPGSFGVRLHAVLAPVAQGGTCLSLRVLRPATQGLTALAATGAFAEGAEDLVRRIVAGRLAFLVVGGTGTGKTTLLAALLGEVDARERIICVEDAAELAPAHPHVVRLVARPANVEGVGEVGVRDLVRQALRMRPDRIVVGEVRGAEVVDLSTTSTPTTGYGQCVERRRAGVYTRISRDSSLSGEGVERQLEDCLKLAERLSCEVVGKYEDNDIGASTRSRSRPRPQYEAMLAAARAGDIDVIIAYTTSRLTRRPAEMEALIQLAEKGRVEIKCVASSELNLETADGRMVARMLASADAAEAERTSERVRRQALDRAKKGMFHGNIPAFGFRRGVAPDGEVTGIVAHEEHSEWVREAMSRLLRGDSLYGICVSWNEAGRRTRGRGTRQDGVAWIPKTLKGVLLNPALIGKRSHLGELHDAVWSPIVSEQEFRRVGDLLRDPSRREFNRGRARKYPLSGLLRCGLCGTALTSMTGTGGRGPSFVCAKLPYNGCGRVRINHHPLEEYLREMVVQALNSRDVDRAIAPRKDDDGREHELRFELDALTAQRRRVQQGFQTGIYTEEEAALAIAELSGRKDQVGAALHERTQRQVAAEVSAADLLAAGWERKGASWQRSVLGAVLDHVDVGKHPPGVATVITRRRGESEAEFDDRKQSHQLAILRARVNVVWRV